MACFIVPATEAIVTTVASKVLKSKEKKELTLTREHESEKLEGVSKIPFSRKLKWLSNLLWGGSFLLAFEHIWHGEVVPFFPFLTGAMSAESSAAMLHEMATTGVTMAALVTLIWVGMVVVASAMEKKVIKENKIEINGAGV